jgi:hypothetical protein
MIDELLFKVNHLGRDGFVWWIGQVAHRDSWKNDSLPSSYLDETRQKKAWPERCKVRIIGYHPFRRGELEDKDLPWAHIMMDPVFGSGQGGEGMNSNLTGGEVCFGFFLDGDDAQQPVVIGVLSRNKSVKNYPLDDEFAFRPFTGHPGTVSPTKRQVAEDKQPGTENASLPPPASSPTLGSSDVSDIEYSDGQWWGKFDTSNSIPYSELIKSDSVGIASTAFNFNLNFNDSIWTNKNTFAIKAYEKTLNVTYVPPSPCKNNLIGQITQILQDFIGITNTFQKYADTYIDPVLNEVVDITSTIKSAARSIGGIIRLIINSIRSGLLKCITSLFKKYINAIPDPDKPIISPAVKNILNIIYCLFEKLIPTLLDYIEKLLGDMLDSVISAPLCAINQWVTGVLTKVMDTIETGLDPILSGISWLTGGLSNVFSVLNQASNLANQIYNFIGCDDLKCTTPSKWVSNLGPVPQSADNWSKTVESVNIFKGTADDLGSVERAIAGLSLYDQSSLYSDCNSKVNNPKTQDDLPPLYPGVKFKKCIPPEIAVYGDGYGAKLEPIVYNGKIVGAKVISSGFGYTIPPTLTVIDNSGYGSGAKLLSKIDSKGSIESILVTSFGSGYCSSNLQSNASLDIILTSDKNRIYEGESVTFTIISTDTTNPLQVDYLISGIDSEYIVQYTSGTLTLVDGRVDIQIDTIPDKVVNTKALTFEVQDYNAEKTVLVEDVTEKPSNKLNAEYRLSSDVYTINEGSKFKITLITKNIEDGTMIPFKISGVDTKLIEKYDSYASFEIYDNKAELTFITTKGIIQENQIFRLELNNEKASVGVLISKIKSGSNTENKLCLTGIEMMRPGIGYNINDTATDGINTFGLIISPANGAIFGVKPLSNIICGYDLPPVIRINTITGIGAELLPIMKLDTTNSNSTLNSGTVGIGTGAEILNIVDCI